MIPDKVVSDKESESDRRTDDDEKMPEPRRMDETSNGGDSSLGMHVFIFIRRECEARLLS